MTTITSNKKHNVVTISFHGEVDAQDEERLRSAFEGYVLENGHAPNLFITSDSFPKFEDFDVFKLHLNFIGEHSSEIEKVAVVSDAFSATLLPPVANLFLKAKIKHFHMNEKNDAMRWLEGEGQ